MTDQTDSLKEIFLTVSENGTVTESQQEGPSYEPVDEADDEQSEVVASVADGLGDAIGGSDISPGEA